MALYLTISLKLAEQIIGSGRPLLVPVQSPKADTPSTKHKYLGTRTWYSALGTRDGSWYSEQAPARRAIASFNKDFSILV